MQIIEVSSIKISDERQRRVFNPEALGKLAESIVSKGLMHPIILRPDGETLVSGERRLRAIELINTMGQKFSHNGQPIPQNSVPFTLLSDLTEDDIYEAELEENIRRENLTPQEEMQAIARLHELRARQNEGQTLNATAAEVWPDAKSGSGNEQHVRDALLVSQHISDPSVAKAKTKKEAAAAVHKLLKRQHAEKWAQEYSATEESKAPHKHFHGDFAEVLETLSEDTFEVLLTDPPYGISANDFGDMADNEHEYEDSYEWWAKNMPVLAAESFRLCKPEAHAYVFCDINNFDELNITFTCAGWNVWRKPLIWNKRNGMLPHPKYGPRYTYEAILFASKGKKEYLAPGAADVIDCSLARDVRHAAEKPVDLYVELLRRSALPGDHVLDPFMGSGTIFPAANRAKLHATGVEKFQTQYGFAIQRLEEELEG